MNPGAFAQGIETGAEKGVKIGFEFEVCVPKETITGKAKEDPNVKKGWWDKVLAEYPGDRWAKEVDPDDLSYTVTIKKDITINGKTFKHRDDLEMGDLFNAWAEKIVEAQVKKIFDTLGPNIKKRILKRWQEEISTYPENNNIQRFIDICQYSLNQDKMRWAVRRAGSPPDDVRPQFWIDVFGTADLAVLANDPRLKWDEDQILSDIGIYDDDDDYYGNDTDYDGAAKVMKPVIEQAFGKTIVFHSYHQSKKDTSSWYIEPDGSICPGTLDPDHPNDPDSTSSNGDGSCEIVTPPLPVKQGIEALKTFYGIAKQMKLYTGKGHGTGLHINVSIPEKLDVLKLAVFVGDEYVLAAWGRENNHYVDSIIKSLKSEINSDGMYDRRTNEHIPYNPSVKKHYKELLQIAKETSDEHTASVSFNGKYVSFRHAGGDYLNQQQAVIDVVGRFVRAMVIAADPNAYRKEYLAKLLKLTQSDQPQKTNNMQISSILAYKTKPINGMWGAVFATKGNVGVKALLDSQDEFEISEMQPCPAAMAPAALEEIIAAGAIAKYSQMKDNVAKIKKNPTKRALYFMLGKQNKLDAYNDNDIYGRGYDENGVAATVGFQAQPGTPVHAILFKQLLNNAKERMIQDKRFRASMTPTPAPARGGRNPGSYGPGPGYHGGGR